jgi:peptide/nickel transport system permease protein
LVFHYIGVRIPAEFHLAPPDAGRSRGCHHAKGCQGMTSQAGIQRFMNQYAEPVWHQQTHARTILPLCEKCNSGRFWYLVQPISQIGGRHYQSSIWWTVALQFPAIIVGWLIGNTLGALAAYLKGGFDKVLMPVSIFVSNLPAFGMAVILLVIFGINLKWFPTSGGYGFDLIPNFSWNLYGL